PQYSGCLSRRAARGDHRLELRTQQVQVGGRQRLLVEGWTCFTAPVHGVTQRVVWQHTVEDGPRQPSEPLGSGGIALHGAIGGRTVRVAREDPHGTKRAWLWRGLRRLAQQSQLDLAVGG